MRELVVLLVVMIAVGRARAQPATHPATTQPLFVWKASWKGWNGLQVKLTDETHFMEYSSEMLDRMWFDVDPSDHTRFSLNLGGRLEVDAATYGSAGELDGLNDDVKIRRAQLTAGGMFRLIAPVNYKLDIAYIPDRVHIKQAYLIFPRLEDFGRTQVGLFQPPMSLDLTTSSRDLSFMEPAAPLQALVPGKEYGIQNSDMIFNGRATWKLGVFGDGESDDEYGNASENYGNAIARVTTLVVDQLEPDRPAQNRLMHLGLSANYQYSATSTVRYRARPESYGAPYVIDTGKLDSDNAVTVAAEAAWVNGAFTLQSEFIDSFVDVNGDDDLNFYGLYLSAGLYLTGESRPYDKHTGSFSRLVPRHEFNPGHGGWGAVEVAARYSYTSLTDGAVQGGRLSLLMGEVNWHLTSHIRWMFGTGYGTVRGSESDGELFIAQTRLAIDF